MASTANNFVALAIFNYFLTGTKDSCYPDKVVMGTGHDTVPLRLHTGMDVTAIRRLIEAHVNTKGSWFIQHISIPWFVEGAHRGRSQLDQLSPAELSAALEGMRLQCPQNGLPFFEVYIINPSKPPSTRIPTL